MSASSSTTASTPTNDPVPLPDPLGNLSLPPPAPHHGASMLSTASLAAASAHGDLDADRAYLDAAELELLEEIQLVQNKLTESRQRHALQKNRRLLRRNPSVSDSIMQLGHDPDHAPTSRPRQTISRVAQPSPGLQEVQQERPPRRIISVSFRLPKKEHRESVRQQLFDTALPPRAVFSLQSASNFPFVWLGTADSQTDVESANFEDVYGEEHRAAWRSVNLPESGSQKRRRSRYVPVVLPDEPELLHNYEMYCEETLWPLLHYDYASVGSAGDLEEFWSAYRFINQRFAEAVSEIYEDGDLIWVHNYQLMLLPSLLRESLWYGKIGFFLYTPFPSAEIFRILPHRTELLRGVIGSDLIGFHSYDYSKQFVSSCTRLLGVDGNPNSIEADPRVGRRCEIGIYPGGIDVRALKNHVSSKVVKSRVAELRARFEGRKLVVGVDRLDDCFAGIPLKLLAYEQLLTENPDLVGKVVLIQVAMLPKQSKNIASYRAQQIQVNELVGRINSSFGTFAFSPIHYINSELSPAEVHALMSVGHVCVVSTVRDGMGLVPHEWIVCQHGGYKGPIVLSEFAGAAHSFATALHVNPWDIDDLVAKVKVALDMSDASRNMRNEAAYRFVTTHTASLWGFNFLEDLEQSDGAQSGTGSFETPALDSAAVLRAYLGSSAQPSPVSSSNVLSSLNSGYGQSPRMHGDQISGVVRTAFGASPRIGSLSPEENGARLGDIFIGEGLPKGAMITPPDKLEPSWMFPSPSESQKKRKRAKLFVLDLDGTLVQFQAITKLGAPPQQVIDLILKLQEASPLTFILILSSRDRSTVLQWLGELNVFLAAEDGAFFRAPGSSSWISLFHDNTNQNYGLHHSPSGQYSQATDSSNSTADNVLLDKEVRDEDVLSESKAADLVTRASSYPLRKEVTDDSTKKPQPFCEEDGKRRGSAQSIISLNNDTSQSADSAVRQWKDQVLPVMQHFAERTPGVVLEEGDATLTWHYVDADTDFGRWQARDLYKHLESFLLQRLNIDLMSDEGRRRWIKVRPQGVDKTQAVVRTLEHIRDFPETQRPGPDMDIDDESTPYIDFVLCIGDDRADEGMFEFFHEEQQLEKLGVHSISKRIFTCRVGSSATSASCFLESSQRVVELLEELIST